MIKKKWGIVFPAVLAAILTVTAAQAGNVVTINSNNVLAINGRDVFPIGFTLGPPPGAKTPEGKRCCAGWSLSSKIIPALPYGKGWMSLNGAKRKFPR